jgi:diguanylate cyclase (GGDEF)-like protein
MNAPAPKPEPKPGATDSVGQAGGPAAGSVALPSALSLAISLALWVAGWAGLFGLGAGSLSALPWPELLALTGLAALPTALTSAVLWRVYLGLRAARAQAAIEERALPDQHPESEGVGTRQQFIGLAEREWARCQRYGDDGALLLVDIDRLRRINESVGHRCGDAVLQEVINRVGSTLRQADVMARFDGAQLAVFLAHTDPLGALDAAERIRLVVASMPFRFETSIIVATVSVGVAQVHAGQMALDGLIQECEAALAAAKEAGRNCVRAAPILPRQSDPSRSVSPS